MIKLSEIIEKIPYIDIKKVEDFDVVDVSNNSKEIKDGFIFVAVKGSIFDGHAYIDQAIKNGAKAVIFTEDIDIIGGITYIKVENPRDTFARISNIINDYPSKKMNLVAVTGTNGKTTTSKLIAFLIGRIFGKCANIGTDGADIDGEIIPTSNTTPDINILNKILNKCLEKNIKYLTLEASSHGLAQKRLGGIDFKYGIFNNLSTEHLDYHKTMENYFAAKLSLFDQAENTIANIDDPWGAKAKDIFPKTITFGQTPQADIRAENIRKDENGIRFEIQGVDFFIKTIADYEIYNSLAAITTLYHMGASLEEISANISDFKGVASRFEYMDNDLGINIIIDFAHTPRAYEEIFKSLPRDKKKIVVFGIQGDRDENFRRLVGEIVAKNQAFAVITTDDPKFKTYEEISADIIKGIESFSGTYKMVKDRKEAIKEAIKMADMGDYVLLLGKGEEDFIKLKGNEKTPYSEKETLKEVLEEL